jgi:glyoxylase I family protein
MTGSNRVLAGGGFHHIAIKVSDFPRTVELYKRGLGMVETARWGEGDSAGVMLDTGDGNYLEIFAGGVRSEPLAPMRAAGPIVHMCFRTREIDSAVAQAQAAGFTVAVPAKDVVIPAKPREIPVRLAFLHGPDGEVIELFQNDVT